MSVLSHIPLFIQSGATALSDGAAHILGRRPPSSVKHFWGNTPRHKARVWFHGDSKSSQVCNDN